MNEWRKEYMNNYLERKGKLEKTMKSEKNEWKIEAEKKTKKKLDGIMKERE